MYSVRFALGMNESNFKCTMHHLAVIYCTTDTNILLAFSGNKYCNDYQRSLPWLSNDSLLITWTELKMPTFGNTSNLLFPRQLRDSFATWVAAQIYNFFVAIDGLVYWILMLLQFNNANIGLFQIYIVIAIQKCLTRVCILFFLRKVRVSSRRRLVLKRRNLFLKHRILAIRSRRLRRQTYLRGLPAASALRAHWLASLAGKVLTFLVNVARFARKRI